jgi:hypothetical protein
MARKPIDVIAFMASLEDALDFSETSILTEGP